MMKVRVYKNPDGSVRVLHPNPKLRLPGESDDSLISRIATQVEKGDPSLAGLSFIDVDRNTLPVRQERDKWRLNGQRVIVDPTVMGRN